MQRQHRGILSAVVGDEQAPALLDLNRNPRPQIRQQEIARLGYSGRAKTVHPDPGDLVIFVGAGGTDDWRHGETDSRENGRHIFVIRSACAMLEPGMTRGVWRFLLPLPLAGESRGGVSPRIRADERAPSL